jgi:hypothetical protein
MILVSFLLMAVPMDGLLTDAKVGEVRFVVEAHLLLSTTVAWSCAVHVPFLCRCAAVLPAKVVVDLAGVLLLAMWDGVRRFHHLLELPSPPIVWDLVLEELYWRLLYASQLGLLR